MADNQHFQYVNKLPYFKEMYGNLKRCLKAYSYTRKEHWTWSTNMAAMASKFNFECVIQYYTDQWLRALTRLSLREIIKPPQLNKTMTSKLFKDYRSMFA